MRLDINSEIWENIFVSIRDEFITDPDFHNRCIISGVLKVYEEEFLARGITIIDLPLEEIEPGEGKWSHAEIADDNYLELVLRCG